MATGARLLIVNGDDFGLSHGINEGIIYCHREGILTSTTLLTGLDGSEEAAALAGEFPSLGVGIHLNFGPILASCSGSSKDHPYTFQSCKILPYFLCIGLFAGKKFRGDLISSFRQQVEWALKRDLKITHLDTHKHLHMWPTIASLVFQVAMEYGICAVRFPYEPFWMYGPANLPVRVALVIFYAIAAITRRAFLKYNLRSPDHFRGIIQTGHWTKKTFLNILKSLPYGVTEVMVHPGYSSGLKRDCTRLIASREIELRILTDREVVNFCRKNNIGLVNYRIFQSKRKAN